MNLEYGLKTMLCEDTVFYRDYTSKVRMEVSLSIGEEFKKFKFLFQELEALNDGTQKKRQKGSIEIYLDCEKAMELVHFIKNGRYGQMAKIDLQNATKNGYFPNTFWMINGGTMPNMLKGDRQRGGKAEYRELRLKRSSFNDKLLNSNDPKERAKGNDIKFLLTAMACDGNVIDQKGGRKLITPVMNNNRPQNSYTVNFMITYEQLIALAYAIERELCAYRTSQYMVAELVKKFGLVADNSYEATKPLVANDNTETVSETNTPTNVQPEQQSYPTENYDYANEFLPW